MGVLLGSLVGNLVGDLLGIPVGDLLGEATGAAVGGLVGCLVGLLLGEAVGDELGASHNPHNALQFALTSILSAHLCAVLNLATQTHDLILDIPEMKKEFGESSHSATVESKILLSSSPLQFPHVSGQFIWASSNLHLFSFELDTHEQVLDLFDPQTSISNLP